MGEGMQATGRMLGGSRDLILRNGPSQKQGMEGVLGGGLAARQHAAPSDN